MNKLAFIELRNCSKKYGTGATTVWANKDLSFDIEQGELVIILGSSGAGKSTLLNILGGMENVTRGEVIVNGNNIANYSAKELTKYRRNEIGFVFQFYNLIPNLTAKENKVLKILQDRSLKKNSTVIIVTHNAALAPIADKVIRIQDGKIKQVENNAYPQDIEKIEW